MTRRTALWVAVLAVAACSRQSHPEPQLAADAALFCGARDRLREPARISDVAAYLASNIKSPELLDVFAAIPPEGDPHLIEKLRAIVQKAGVTSCPMLDWMEKRSAEPIDAAPAPPVLVFAIRTDGSVTVSDRHASPIPVGEAEIELPLRAASVRDHATEVIVISEPAVPWQRALNILQAAKQSGLTNVAIGIAAEQTYAIPLPSAATAEPMQPHLVIQIRPDGGTVVRDRAIADAELDALFTAEASKAPPQTIIISVGPTTTIGKLAAIMARAKHAGLTMYAVATPVP